MLNSVITCEVLHAITCTAAVRQRAFMQFLTWINPKVFRVNLSIFVFYFLFRLAGQVIFLLFHFVNVTVCHVVNFVFTPTQ